MRAWLRSLDSDQWMALGILTFFASILAGVAIGSILGGVEGAWMGVLSVLVALLILGFVGVVAMLIDIVRHGA
jgi:hypothetical protein